MRDLNALKQEVIELKAKNNVLQEKNIRMHRKIKRLKEDPKFIENIARQELKMIGKDEIVFKFKEDSTARINQNNGAVKKTSENLYPKR
ncbi:MAG: septum formation initiator family protein [Desulfobacteraceae bacterium]|nr:septum formation initiator family protein [Desulfobacteraceae bacterium]